MGTKLERQQSKQIEFLGKTKEQALKEKAAALKEMTRALRASEKLLHQEQMKNKKNALYKVKNNELPVQVKELESLKKNRRPDFPQSKQ